MDVFVFGSNLLDIHGAGAARRALAQYGAQYGVGVGRTGAAYAIPTKKAPTMLESDRLSLKTISGYVGDFMNYARAHPDDVFLTTRIGCGLAGYRSEDIALFFRDAPDNVRLPRSWHETVFGAVREDRVSFND